jgi:GT2 family glycosyltransferase
VPPLPSVTIAIATKNRPADIVRALAAIRAQKTQPEAIIVVDQSTPAYELPAQPGLAHRHVPELSGLTAARNLAIDENRSDVLFFLDDDAELLGDAVGAIAETFASHPEAVGVGCTIEDVLDTAPRKLVQLRERIFERGFFNSYGMRLGENGELRRVRGAAMAFRAALLAIERFDTTLRGYSYGEDWEFSIRARRHGKLLLAPGAVVRHNSSPVNRFDARRALQTRWTNTLYFYDKLADEHAPLDPLWRRWWMLGELLLWWKTGSGWPARSSK